MTKGKTRISRTQHELTQALYDNLCNSCLPMSGAVDEHRLCMEIQRELGKGHDEIIYKDALVVELNSSGNSFFAREKL